MGKNISKEKMEEYKKTIKGKFDEKEIKHMYKLFHKAAPTGKMGKKEFKKYIGHSPPHWMTVLLGFSSSFAASLLSVAVPEMDVA